MRCVMEDECRAWHNVHTQWIVFPVAAALPLEILSPNLKGSKQALSDDSLVSTRPS